MSPTVILACLCHVDNVRCSEILHSPSDLLQHICENHIEKKAEVYECLWEGCRYSGRKRDHLVSHTKTHVPLKLFRCEVFGFIFLPFL